MTHASLRRWANRNLKSMIGPWWFSSHANLTPLCNFIYTISSYWRLSKEVMVGKLWVTLQQILFGLESNEFFQAEQIITRDATLESHPHYVVLGNVCPWMSVSLSEHLQTAGLDAKFSSDVLVSLTDKNGPERKFLYLFKLDKKSAKVQSPAWTCIGVKTAI